MLTAGWIVYCLDLSRVRPGLGRLAGLGAHDPVRSYSACSDGVAKAFVADLVPASLRGTAYGIFHTAIGLAALPASLIAGILWDGIGSWRGWGGSAPFYFGAIVATTASLLLAFVMPSHLASALPDQQGATCLRSGAEGFGQGFLLTPSFTLVNLPR